jgi:RNA polymerase sigma-70 factor (ECF subfamily)
LTQERNRQDMDERAQQPNIEAFETLYRQYGERIYHFCFRLCGSVPEAEDLTQEVFVAALLGLDRFEGRSAVLTWLYRIAVFRWRHWRSRKEPLAVSLDAGRQIASSRDAIHDFIERQSLEHALAGLTPDQREAFVLVKMEGLKYREAAEVLGTPLGTVQSRVFDAITRLRERLGQESPGREPPRSAPVLTDPLKKEIRDAM